MAGPICPFPWGQEGQELPCMLNSSLLFYLVKGHFPALYTGWLKKIFLGPPDPQVTIVWL